MKSRDSRNNLLKADGCHSDRHIHFCVDWKELAEATEDGYLWESFFSNFSVLVKDGEIEGQGEHEDISNEKIIL